ncbi:hypothetical protein BGW42_000001 [Actinomortierella wolfii]|nr:hypothetical protein BGW42_000001 [Actinomortierella wolfii]
MLGTLVPTENSATVINHVLLVGNPGVGKSYLLNSLGGHFASGFSAVDGLTSQCDYKDVMIDSESGYVRLVDVPGLLETKGSRMKENSRAITEALRKEGKFKLIFVLAESSGRVQPSDLYMIGKVMKAIDYTVDVGLVINKVPDGELEYYQKVDVQECIIGQLNTVANGKFHSSRYMVIPRLPKSEKDHAQGLLISLLSKMDGYKDIPNVKDIFSTDYELSEFQMLLMAGRRAIKQTLSDMFKVNVNESETTLRQVSTGQNDVRIQHSTVPTKQSDQEELETHEISFQCIVPMQESGYVQPEPQEIRTNNPSPRQSRELPDNVRNMEGTTLVSHNGGCYRMDQVASLSVNQSGLQAALNVDESRKNSTAHKDHKREKDDTFDGQSMFDKPQPYTPDVQSSMLLYYI